MRYDPRPPRPSTAGPRRRARRGPARLAIWILPLVFALLIGSLTGIAVASAIHMPRVESLADFTPGLITHLYDRHGQAFATFARERRMLLEEGEVSDLLQRAVVATEDRNFFRHGGIDAGGVVRAAIADLRHGEFVQGASTITMQLARQLYLTREKTWRRKIEEALLAVELEKRFSKQQILTLYLNLVFFGHGNYGAEAAAREYFGKPSRDLTLPEAAALAGIIQQPSRLSPYRRPELVLARRNEVLRRMVEAGFVSARDYQNAVRAPLLIAPRQDPAGLGRYFAEDVRQALESRFDTPTVLEKGLQVETTLDARIQATAEDALRAGLRELDHRKGWRGPLYRLGREGVAAAEAASPTEGTRVPGAWTAGMVLGVEGDRARIKLGDEVRELDRRGIAWTGRRRPADLLRPGDVAWFRTETTADAEQVLHLEQEPEIEGAIVVLESSTGAVRAMVGGWDFGRSKFNRATQARRQVGSAFKPFVYGAALETGFTPADTLFDGPAVFLGADARASYSPRNYYRKYYGVLTLRRALELSVNVTTVKLLDLVGVERVIDFARRCGIRSSLPPYPSLGLGSADLIPLELAAAYASFANHGIYVEPYLVERVKLPNGRVLDEHVLQAQKAMDAPVAFVLGHMLQGVIDRGTASSVAGIELDLAGKTGTTDDFTDAWFVGFTPRYTVLVWVGYDVKRRLGNGMTGAVAALPIWRDVIERGLAEGWLDPEEGFAPPPGVVFTPVEYATGFLPGPGAERIVREAFVEGTEPALHYEPRWGQIVRLPWYQQRAFYIPKEGERMPEGIGDWALVRQAWAGE